MNCAIEEIIDSTAAHVRKALGGDSSGHDWWHVWRVWQTARRLAAAEGADREVVELAALLHDIADWKFHGGDVDLGPRRAAEWLESLGAPDELVRRVADAVASVTFKGAGVATPTSTPEAACVQDADRLDAVGAVGIARAFAFGGARGRLMYDPDHPPELHADFAAYRRNSGPTINHFHEKLLLLKDRMQTAAGRAEAERRHAYMLDFLQQFHAEWNFGAAGPELPNAAV